MTFIGKLDSALKDGNAEFLISRLVPFTVTCRPEDVPPRIGGPQCTEVGQTFEAVTVGHWRGSGGAVPVVQVSEQLSRLVTSALADDSDKYGSGRPMVYATNIDGDRHDAILTAMVPPTGGIARVTLGTSWALVNGEWKLQSVMTNVIPSEFLDPSDAVRSGLYKNWTRFQAP